MPYAELLNAEWILSKSRVAEFFVALAIEFIVQFVQWLAGIVWPIVFG